MAQQNNKYYLVEYSILPEAVRKTAEAKAENNPPELLALLIFEFRCHAA